MVLDLLAPLRDRAGLQVRRRRQLERDLPVAHPARQLAELHLHLVALARDDPQVLGQAHPVPEPQRATVDEGRADGIEPGRLPRVHRRREESRREEVERLAMLRRREAVFGARDVEADDPAPTPLDGELGDLQRAIGVSHRRDQLPDTDVAAGALGGIFALLDALLHGLDDLVEREAASQVLLRRPADLAVDDAVGGEILNELARHPREPLAGLHHRRGDVERLEVLDERARIALVGEPVRELVGVIGRQVEVDVVGELDDRGRTQRAVEVIVQRDLGESAQRDALQARVAVGLDGHGRSPRLGVGCIDSSACAGAVGGWIRP